MNPYKRAEQIEDCLSRIERGLYSTLNINQCCDYISWMAKFKKVPREVWEPLCDKATEILEADTARMRREF